jgi:nucleoside-diphosphate-sugar epimerase
MVGHQLLSRIATREPVLTRHALRLLITPKALANQKIKRELGFTPRFTNFRQGLEVTVHGLPNHA